MAEVDFKIFESYFPGSAPRVSGQFYVHLPFLIAPEGKKKNASKCPPLHFSFPRLPQVHYRFSPGFSLGIRISGNNFIIIIFVSPFPFQPSNASFFPSPVQKRKGRPNRHNDIFEQNLFSERILSSREMLSLSRDS